MLFIFLIRIHLVVIYLVCSANHLLNNWSLHGQSFGQCLNLWPPKIFCADQHSPNWAERMIVLELLADHLTTSYMYERTWWHISFPKSVDTNSCYIAIVVLISTQLICTASRVTGQRWWWLRLLKLASSVLFVAFLCV